VESRLRYCGGPLEPNAPSIANASDVFTNEFDSGSIERLDNPGQRINNATHVTFAAFHSLDRRQRNTGEFSELTLINTKQRSCGS
jgi:hypothetical protein